MKRKDLDFLHDDCCFLDLSSTSRKSRRLDDGLLYVNQQDPRLNAVQENGGRLDAVPTDLTKPASSSEEKAIVLYNPSTNNSAVTATLPTPTTLLFKSPIEHGFSIVLDSSLLPGLKDRLFWPGKLNNLPPAEDAAEIDETSNMAVIPWVAPDYVWPSTETTAPEVMEADEPGDEMMDTEESCNVVPEYTYNSDLQMWPQPHVSYIF